MLYCVLYLSTVCTVLVGLCIDFVFVVFYPPWYLSTNVVVICFTVCLFVCLSVSLFGKPYLGDGLMDSHQISAEHRHWAETSLLPFWSRSTMGPGVGDLNNVFFTMGVMGENRVLQSIR